jgi:hypothetical protein
MARHMALGRPSYYNLPGWPGHLARVGRGSRTVERIAGMLGVVPVIGIYLVIFGLVLLLILGSGAGAGYLLHHWVPSIDVGSAVLAGVVASSMATYLMSRMLAGIGSSTDEGEAGPAILHLGDLLEPGPIQRRGQRKRRS